MYKIFTDGRGIFEKDPKTGYNVKQIGCERTYVILYNDKMVKSAQEPVVGGGINPSNITGECSAVMHGLAEALKLALAFNYKGKIQILHDYIGLKNWLDGSWKAKEDGPKMYVESMKKMIQYAKQYDIEVEFVKVKSKDNQAHTLFYGGK